MHEYHVWVEGVQDDTLFRDLPTALTWLVSMCCGAEYSFTYIYMYTHVYIRPTRSLCVIDHPTVGGKVSLYP